MKNILLISTSLLLIMGLMACNTSKKALMNTPSEKLDSIYNITVGETLVIELASNASTGYKWELTGQSSSKIISFEGREYTQEEKNQNLIGAGGTDLWSFKGTKKGEAVLHLRYIRGDGEVSKEKFFKVIVGTEE